ncbi:MAG: YggS family pyridoxal phosphate-dependent enzyme [Sutterella sp.]|nr:YggS family pyridoxal phosphate-dependent enzyme [Sutterella sp.]
MSELKPGLPERLEAVRAALRAEEARAGRPAGDVRLIAVGKTFPVSACELAYQCGQRDFGENYVQEGVEKVEAFRASHPQDPGVWHFIGPIQSNKTRAVAEHFDWVHSVDRLKIAARLAAQRPAGMPPLNVLIEVNIDGEPTKSGVTPSEAEALAAEIVLMPGLRLRGLMAIPAPASSSEERREPLHAMKRLFDRLRMRFPTMDTLSMGMSADMTEAVDEGATMVRIGSAVFGPRDYSHACRAEAG